MNRPRRCSFCQTALEPNRHHVVEDIIGRRFFVHGRCAPRSGMRLVAKWRRR